MTLAGLSYAIGLGVYLGVVLSIAFLILLLTAADVWLLYILIRKCLHSRFSTHPSPASTLKSPASLSPERPGICSSTERST